MEPSDNQKMSDAEVSVRTDSEEPSSAQSLESVDDIREHLPFGHQPDDIYTVVIEPRKGWLGINFQELWYYRELLFFLIWRDMKARYKQTVMGAGWALVRPFIQMVVFSLFFGRLAEMPSEKLPYPIYMYAALLPWTLFASAVNQSGISLVAQASLITKVYFPRIFIPTANAGICLLDFVFALMIYIGLFVYYLLNGWSLWPGVTVLLLPVLLVLICMAALGMGYLLSSLTIVFRDFRTIIAFLVQIWMFASPVVWAPNLMSPTNQLWASLNPMFGVIAAFRAALLNRQILWGPLGISSVICVALFFFGLFIFRRMERRFADVA